MDEKKLCEMLENNKMTDILDIIFKAREDELANITEEDKKRLKEINAKINAKYVAYKNALDNIPDAFVETRRGIIDAFNEYCETIPQREGYSNEKYYKAGLRDGLRLLSKCF